MTAGTTRAGVIYKGRDNSVTVRLVKLDAATGADVVQDMTAVSRVVATIGEVEIDSDETATAFDLSDMESGNLTLKFGGVSDLVAGRHEVRLDLYSPGWPSGLTWVSALSPEPLVIHVG